MLTHPSMKDSKSTCLKKTFPYSLTTSLRSPPHSTRGEVSATLTLLFGWWAAALSTEHSSLAVRRGRPEVSEKKKLLGLGSVQMDKSSANSEAFENKRQKK